jgi:hypothetical protein
VSNPLKGEVEFEADGKTYTLRYSADAICNLEEKAGRGFPVIAGELMDPDTTSLRLVRMAIWAGLREHHPDITLQQAGELILAAGGMKTMMERFDQALRLAFPDIAAQSGDGARPPTPDQTPASTGPATLNGGSNSA